MTEQQQQTPIPYAGPSTRPPRPTRHSVFVTLSLLVPTSAVVVKGALLGYAYWRWQTWTLGRLAQRVLWPYSVVDFATVWFFVGICLALAGMVQPERRRWAAVVALGLNGFFFYGQMYCNYVLRPPWWTW